jgi:hypothetical protein
MAACQAAHPAVAPRMGPVIHRLTAHTELHSDGLGFDLVPKHQQACGSRADVPMLVIDRQLLQCNFLGFTELYDTLHPLPRHHEAARIAKFKSVAQEHLKGSNLQIGMLIYSRVFNHRCSDRAT